MRRLPVVLRIVPAAGVRNVRAARRTDAGVAGIWRWRLSRGGLPAAHAVPGNPAFLATVNFLLCWSVVIVGLLREAVETRMQSVPRDETYRLRQRPYQSTATSPRLGTSIPPRNVGILPEFEAGLQDVEGFSHLYVIWQFDRSDTTSDLVGTPPTDDRPHGVFATRSPRRPNPIGLTVVELLGRDGNRLRVKGIDMLEGTPILDIKPYLSSVPEDRLRRGWLAEPKRAARSKNVIRCKLSLLRTRTPFPGISFNLGRQRACDS
jgi:tRNA-Thr(GGU) m(6)t(6)A37 methyltransferase TsaA